MKSRKSGEHKKVLMVQSLMRRWILICVIQVPKGMFAAMQIKQQILLYICIDIFSNSVLFMDSKEIHAKFDKAMREFAEDRDIWDGPMYLNSFVIRLKVNFGFQIFGVTTPKDVEEFLNTNYSNLFKIKHTKDDIIVLSKPIEKQNTKYEKCYFIIKLKSFSVFRANQLRKTISKNSKCILGTNKYKVFNVDTDGQSVMIAAFVDKLKPTVDTMNRYMNEYLHTNFEKIEIQCVSIDDGILADIEIKHVKHTWPCKYYTEVVKKIQFTKKKTFEDIEEELKLEYSKNINEACALLLGHIPPEIVAVIIECLDLTQMFGNMNDYEKYNIISMLLQKKSPSQWLAKKNKLLAWGLSCAQNPGYIPSYFKPFYN